MNGKSKQALLYIFTIPVYYNLIICVIRYLDTVRQQTSPVAEVITASQDAQAAFEGEEQQGLAWGKKLDSQLLDRMSDEQLGQLYELRKESKKAFEE
jgi:hypothetical protein